MRDALHRTGYLSDTRLKYSESQTKKRDRDSFLSVMKFITVNRLMQNTNYDGVHVLPSGSRMQTALTNKSNGVCKLENSLAPERSRLMLHSYYLQQYNTLSLISRRDRQRRHIVSIAY